MFRSVLLTLALAAASAPAVVLAADDCGQELAQVPSFSLEDVNPSSATYGQTLALETYAGKSVLLYFALSTCGHCQTQVGQLQALWEAHREAWEDTTRLVIVALAGGADEISALTDRVADLPILQDTPEAAAEDAYGADRWYTYLLTPDGGLHTLHYSVNLTDSAEVVRLVGQLEAARGEP